MPPSVWKASSRGRRSWSIVAGGLGVVLALATQTSAALAVNRPYWHPGPPWAPLAPHSSEMNLISNLFWIILALSAIVFIGVTGAILYSVARFTAKPDTPEPPQVAGNRMVELAWTIAPTLILMGAFIATAKAIHDINTLPPGKHMDIFVIGHQWWWEFQYPVQGNIIKSPIVTANEVHIPAGYSVHYHIESADVIHSFWVPQLSRQLDANPGQDNPVFVKLEQPGIFSGDCYEYCGEAHAWMKLRMVVQSPAQFAAWVTDQTKPGARAGGLAAVGRKVFMNNTCVSCHAITGTSGGAVGPNLTHLASRWTIGAGAAPMDKQDLIGWIRSPDTYKPGVLMPGYPLLSNHDIQALTAYLLSLK